MAAPHGRLGPRLGGALAGAAAGCAGAYALQRRHGHQVSRDPQQAWLESPPAGRPLAIRSADATMLHAEAFGDEQAPTVVLAHGWTETLSLWTYQIRDLCPDFRLVAYDLRGHGRSGRAAGGDYSLERLGEDLEAVLARVLAPGQRALVAGHSLGAMSIAAWADRHPVAPRIRAAALLNTGLGDLLAEQLLVRYPRFARSFGESLSRRAFVGSKASLPRISSPLQHAVIRYFAFGPAATPAQVAFYERMLIGCPPEVRAALGIAMANMNLLHALENLTVPTLVLAGADDKLTPPAHAHRIGEALPVPGEVLVLPETGHMAPLERPHQVSAALRGLALETGLMPGRAPARTAPTEANASAAMSSPFGRRR